MTAAALVALLLAASAAQPGGNPPPKLPAHADVRYRVEIAGETVGWARLQLACGATRCRARWESALRSPDATGEGAAVVSRQIEVDALPSGAAASVAVRASADGRTRETRRPGRLVPSILAEILLADLEDGTAGCLEVEDEESGERGLACARRHGRWLEGEMAGEAIRFEAARGEAPSDVFVPGQGTRFVADPRAALPRRAPRLFGVEVRPRSGRTPCGLPPDDAAPPAPSELPRRFPPGRTCRERTTRYLGLVARAGLRGRHALGIAHDGRALVWHEWAEVLMGTRWIPVDPSFQQAPARGPRFTVARYEDGDEGARAEAGRKVLACWRSAGR